MAEPATTSASAAAVGLAGAGLLASLGLETAPLFWALIGSSLGMSFAPKVGALRAGIVFVCVLLSSSLLGAWLSVKYAGGEQISRNAFSCLVALFFHPALSVALTKIPMVIDDVRRKYFGASDAA